MDFFAYILAFPIILLGSVFIGFISLFSKFGFLYAFPFLVLSIIFFIARIKKQTLVSFAVALILFLSQLSTLLSWLLSVRDLSPEKAVKYWGLDLPSISTTGFPLRSIELPPPPMAAGVPADIWSDILINNFFWLGVSAVVALVIIFFVKSKANLIKKASLPLFVIAAVILLLSITRFVSWFD